MNHRRFTTFAVIVAASVCLRLAAADKPEVVTDTIKVPRMTEPLTFKMVKIPAGETDAPGGKGGDKVKIKPIWISQYEITWDQYDPYALCQDLEPREAEKTVDAKLRPSKPYADPGYGLRQSGYPARSIHAQAAVEYCKWLSSLSGKKYRLPTEAEWEYACRAGQPPENITDLKAWRQEVEKYAWIATNSLNEAGDEVPHPVGKKEPNAWGLYDMLGNVAEWVSTADGKFVLKGGAYNSRAGGVKSTASMPNDPAVLQIRDPQDPKSHWWLADGPHVGFRIVREDD